MRASACLLIGVVSLFGWQGDSATPQITRSLKQLGSERWSQRSSAFYTLVRSGQSTAAGTEFPIPDGVLGAVSRNPSLRDGIVVGLTALLDRETTLVNLGRAPLSEEYSTYYGDLIEAIATLRDTRSSHVLFRCLNTGNMAISAVAGFGDDALAEALNAMPTADEETRRSPFRLFAQMAEPKNMLKFTRQESRAELSQVLLKGATDQDPFNRLAVVPGLATLGSAEAIAALKRLADTDPFSGCRTQGVHYPVRDAASKSLHDLAAHTE